MKIFYNSTFEVFIFKRVKFSKIKIFCKIKNYWLCIKIFTNYFFFRYADDEIIVIERWYPRRNSYVFLANLGNKSQMKDLSFLYYGGQVVVGPLYRLNKDVYFKELTIPPGEAFVIKLDKWKFVMNLKIYNIHFIYTIKILMSLINTFGVNLWYFIWQISLRTLYNECLDIKVPINHKSMRNHNVQKNEFIIIFIKNDTYDRKRNRKESKSLCGLNDFHIHG